MSQITVNDAFEARTPEEWLVLDDDGSEASLRARTNNPRLLDS
jgi:hypothetical protein